jgi:hypothetical protein
MLPGRKEQEQIFDSVLLATENAVRSMFWKQQPGSLRSPSFSCEFILYKFCNSSRGAKYIDVGLKSNFSPETGSC